MQFDTQDIKRIQKTFLESVKSAEAEKISKHIHFIDKHFELFSIPGKRVGEEFKKLAELNANNPKKRIIYYIKAIKYLPDDISIKEKFIYDIIFFLQENDKEFVRNDLKVLKKEISKFLKFVQLKWGRESKLAMNIYIVINEIERVNYLSKDNEEGPLSEFISKLEKTLNNYRPVEQALDYASQIIYNTITKK